MNEPIVIQGDCLETLRSMPDSYVDAIVTDPPYGLAAHKTEVVSAALAAWVTGDRESVPNGRGFMGKEWDAFVPPPAVWDECMRVLKPGGHMLVFAGSRTVDLMGLSIRLAGFEMRDTLQWLYGSGFPKSMSVSKSIDKDLDDDAPMSDAAREWEGWGTALKPGAEPIVLARKPIVSTVAANVLAHGTGGINVDACRVGDELITAHGGGVNVARIYGAGKGVPAIAAGSNPHHGRFPANVVLSHSEDCDDECAQGCAVAELDSQSDSSSRFFATFRYEKKASTKERPKVNGVAHPTVKPVALMRWLTRLITPPNGTVLDPFAGSGTTLQAARDEGFASIGIEREADYIPLINERLAA